MDSHGQEDGDAEMLDVDGAEDDEVGNTTSDGIDGVEGPVSENSGYIPSVEWK